MEITPSPGRKKEVPCEAPQAIRNTIGQLLVFPEIFYAPAAFPPSVKSFKSVKSVVKKPPLHPIGRTGATANPLGTFLYTPVGGSNLIASIGYPNGQTATFSYFANTGKRMENARGKTHGVKSQRAIAQKPEKRMAKRMGSHLNGTKLSHLRAKGLTPS